MRLYYHKTDGGAEYLMDTFIEWEHNGKSGREGRITDDTQYIVRIDGDIEKDAELTVVDKSTNWRKEAKDYAEDAISGYSLDEAIKQAVKDNDNIDDAWEDVYQGDAGNLDVPDIAWEVCDSSFIHNDLESLKDAMDCINELDEFSSADSGLWEGQNDYWDIINIQANDVLRGAVMYELENIVREKLEKEYNKLEQNNESI